MDLSHFFGIKYCLTVIGGFLVMLGSTVEPSVGIWVISLGGALLTIALGEDQNLIKIISNIIIGLFWGIFGSQVIHAWEPTIPQIADAFFMALFGVNATKYIIRNLQTNSFEDMVIAVVSRIIPWKGREKK